MDRSRWSSKPSARIAPNIKGIEPSSWVAHYDPKPWVGKKIASARGRSANLCTEACRWRAKGSVCPSPSRSGRSVAKERSDTREDPYRGIHPRRADMGEASLSAQKRWVAVCPGVRPL